MIWRNNKKINYLFVAFVAELLLMFYLRNDVGYILSPLLITTSGIFLAVYPYFIILKAEPKVTCNKEPIAYLYCIKRWSWIGFVCLSVIFIFSSYLLFQAQPVNIAQSDIIPFIRDVMVKRFINGEAVYAPVKFNDYPVMFTPNYLPFQWLPFALAVLANVDMRWISVLAFISSTAFYIYNNNKSDVQNKNKLWHAFLPFAVLFSIYIKQPRDAAHTIEILIMAYYLFLSSALFVKGSFIKGLSLTLPLLSRFSLLFWLPVYFYDLLSTSFKTFLLSGLMLLCFILVFFIMPFVLPDPAFLKTFNDIYLDGAIGEWNGQAWQQPGDRPFQLFQGFGFASWFYMFFDGSLKEKILALKMTLMIVCVISLLIPIFTYKKARNVVSSELFSLMALKFCLTFFYAFILVPYIYLFWVPLMVSVVILSRVAKEKI
ncbi:MAG: hypothetical protein H7296_01470 [Bacteroidia bacterium]|nr:hypothetical protein [Bacteroidia bacterium]